MSDKTDVKFYVILFPDFLNFTLLVLKLIFMRSNDSTIIV